MRCVIIGDIIGGVGVLLVEYMDGYWSCWGGMCGYGVGTYVAV